MTTRDDRYEYREERLISFGRINEQAVVVVFTWRSGSMRVISMRKAHQEEMENAGMD